MTKLQLRELRVIADRSIAIGSIRGSDHKALIGIIDRLLEDCFERCASCYNWIDYERVVKIVANVDNGYPSAFVLCNGCFPVKAGTEAAFDKRVLSYIAKGEREDD